MRCITITGRAFDGIRLVKHNNMFQIEGPELKGLAFVTYRDFDLMVQKGHASYHSQPQRFEKVADFFGKFQSGPVIYRCDISDSENGIVYLIPEKEESKKVLAWAPRICSNRTALELIHTPSRTLSQKIDRRDNKRHNLMLLEVDYPANFYSNARCKKPGTGPSFRKPMRKTEYTLEMILRRSIVVDRDGVVSITRPNTKMVFWH